MSRLVRKTRSWIVTIVSLALAVAILALIVAGVLFVLDRAGVSIDVALVVGVVGTLAVEGVTR